MPSVEIVKPTRKETRWAVGREFTHLPPVDPAFREMGLLRRALLRYLILPTNYMQHLVGALLKVDGAPAAYLFARPRSISLRIDSLAVEDAYRRVGFAGRLMEHARGLARERKLGWLSAGITPENTAAFNLFSKHGYRAYRPHGWQKIDPAAPVGELEPERIREWGPAELIDAYERWMGVEIAAGDGWAQELLKEEYFKMGLYTRARHWACLDENGEEVGYLRISGLRGTMTAFIACDPAWWDRTEQLVWLGSALAEYPLRPQKLLCDLASSGHDAAASECFEAAGFNRYDRPRYLMFKKI